MSEGHGSEKGKKAKPRRVPAEVVELRESANLRSFPRARTALLVLGMHRSGTSALTRVLSLLGAELPKGLMEPVAGDNPRGFWESREIATLHDELLAAAGSSWDDVSPLPAGWFSSPAAGDYEDRLLCLLERDFASSSLFVVKDPRIARLVPLWQSVLRRFSADPRYVLIVRNPLEVAASLKARNDFLPAKSHLLWLWHLLESEGSTRREPRAFVLFDDLLRDWRGTAQRLERQLRLSWPRSSPTATVEIEEFLTERLRHHQARVEELEARSDAVDWVKRAYSAVLGAASGDGGALAETLDSIRHELAAADLAFAPLVAQGRLHLARKEAELQGVAATLDARQLDNERLSAEMAQRDGELAASRTEIERLGGALAERQTDLERLAAEIARRHGELAAGSTEIERLNGALAERQTDFERFAAEIAHRDSELLAGSAEIERLNGALAERQTEIERFAAEIARRDDELLASGAEIERLNGALAERPTEIERFAAEIARRDSELLAGSAEIERLNGALAERQTEIERFAAEIARRDSELLAGSAEIERLNGALAERQTEIEGFAAEIAERDGKLTARGAEIQRLEAELTARGAEIQRLEAELTDRGAEIQRLGDELATGGNEIQRLGDELARRDSELSRHGAKLDHWERVVEVFRRQGREREDRIAAQGRDLDFLQASQQARHQELRILETEVRTQQTLLELRGDEIVRLRNDLATRRTELTALGREKSGLAANLSLLSERLQELDRQARSRSQEMAAREAEILRLGEEVDGKTRESERLGQALAEITGSAEALGSRLGRAEEQVAALTGMLHGARESVRALEQQVAEERGRVLGFVRSRSWRLTRPLRQLGGGARGLFGLSALAGRLAESRRLSARQTGRRRQRFEESGAAALFDEGYYRARFADPHDSGLPGSGADEVGPDAVLHYLDRGHHEGRDPHPLFDTAFYLQGGPPAADGETDALTHYCAVGAAAGRDPHPLFRGAFYLQQLPHPLAASDNPLLHFLRVGAAAGRAPHPLFDTVFYLDRNPDVAANGVNPLAHYVLHGGTEGRDPHPLFDAAFYLERNPQVARAGENPLRHYLRIGAAQGRDPNPRFDTAFYQETSPDSADAGMTPLEHYLAVGAQRDAATCADGGLRVLIIDHKVPTPDQDAGSLRMSNLISVLQALACRVTFLPHNLFDIEPYTAQLRERDVETLTRPEVDSLLGHLAAHGDEYDLVIVCRVTIADDCFEAVRANCRRAKIVFDTIDLQHLRIHRQAELADDKELLEEAGRVKRRELELARSADTTWVVSPYERQLLLREAPGLDVDVVSTIHEVHGRKSGFAERRDLLFIGGFEHPPNVDAVEWLVEEILPLVHREEPELRAFLIGSKPTDRVLRLASDRVTVTGYLPDVEPYFTRCRLSVAPLRYGAGIKGKVNHSLAYGVPCVLTRIAAEGMGLVHSVDAMIADDAAELAACILALYRDAELWHRLSEGGLENIRSRFSFPVARDAVADSLRRLDPRWAGGWRPAG